jgi:ankyrin repeat protein
MEAVLLPNEEESLAWTKQLLEAGEDPNFKDPLRDTLPFSEAWFRGNLRLMRVLVQYGADSLSNLRDFDIIDIASKSFECTQYMIELGHRLDHLAEDREGLMILRCDHPLTYLLDQQRWDLIEQLTPHGLLDTINMIEESSEEPPLVEMIRDRKLNEAEWLLQHGALPNNRWKNRVMNTPLDHAVRHQDVEAVQLPKQYGADPTIRTWMNLSALDRESSRFETLTHTS